DDLVSKELDRAARIERVTQAVAEEVERDRREENGEAREDQDPDVGLVDRRRLRQQVAPARRRRLDAQSEEREAGLGEDVRRNEDGRVDDDRRDEVRKEVRAHDSPVARTG